MKFANYSFGQIEIDGNIYKEDLVINKGKIQRRNKEVSEPLKEEYGHTPLTLAENIPWDCQTLIVATGEGNALPIADEVRIRAGALGVKIKEMRTPDAILVLNMVNLEDTNAIIHLTC